MTTLVSTSNIKKTCIHKFVNTTSFKTVHWIDALSRLKPPSRCNAFHFNDCSKLCRIFPMKPERSIPLTSPAALDRRDLESVIYVNTERLLGEEFISELLSFMLLHFALQTYFT